MTRLVPKFKRSSEDKFQKLARSLDELAAKDSQRLAREKEVSELRRNAAGALHQLCTSFASHMNSLVSLVRVDLAPAEFTGAMFQEQGANLFQINVSGRVIQLSFQSTELDESTLDLRRPYTLHGAVRWFNQEMLDRDDLKDHRLYYTVTKNGGAWLWVDARTNRTGEVDEEYLAGVLDQLV